MLAHRRKILLSLCGMSPAVLTETIYSLMLEKPTFIPDEIVVITTAGGAACIRKELFESGVWERFRRLMGVKPSQMKFGLSSNFIRSIPSEDGNADAQDIVTSSDNDRASDFIMESLRQFTENPDTRIVFSIAGGRKTMSVLGALAMTMLARDQDRLCHVLVSPPFDSPQLFPKFYFPDPGIRKYALPDGRIFKPGSASLTLCEIPFARLRNLFQKQHLRLPGTYSDTVKLANNVIRTEPEETPKLVFSPKTLECSIGGTPIPLNPAEFVLYWLLAATAKNRKPHIRGQKALLESFLPFAEAISPAAMPEIVNHNHFRNKTDEDLRKLVSSISKKIKAAIRLSSHLQCCLPSPSRGVYGISLPPSAISWPRDRA